MGKALWSEGAYSPSFCISLIRPLVLPSGDMILIADRNGQRWLEGPETAFGYTTEEEEKVYAVRADIG